MNYIGSKLSLLNFIQDTINEVIEKNEKGNIFCDLFAGSGVVSSFFKKRGYKVISNDIQFYSYVLIKHYIENNFSNINTNLFEYFNSLPGIEGFVYKNYCSGSGSGRNYFSNENGKRCDAIRTELERMHRENEISDNDYYFYLGSLINSIDKYANTASVYGAFLKHIKKTAQRKFILEPLEIIDGINGIAYNKNANDLIKSISGDVLYLDPPYNSRQYCNYYHVLETIALYDNPVLHGMTGQRECEDKKSDFCSKRKVEEAFEDIIKNANFKYIFVSYNNEGLMSLDSIKNIMSKYGEYKCYTKNYKRFKADKNTPTKETIEYLHCLIKK